MGQAVPRVLPFLCPQQGLPRPRVKLTSPVQDFKAGKLRPGTWRGLFKAPTKCAPEPPSSGQARAGYWVPELNLTLLCPEASTPRAPTSTPPCTLHTFAQRLGWGLGYTSTSFNEAKTHLKNQTSPGPDTDSQTLPGPLCIWGGPQHCPRGCTSAVSSPTGKKRPSSGGRFGSNWCFLGIPSVLSPRPLRGTGRLALPTDLSLMQPSP